MEVNELFTFSDEYADNKLNEMVELCRRTYYEKSKIQNMVNIFGNTNHSIDYTLGRRVNVPKRWFTDITHYPNMVFEDFGAHVASSEKWFLVSKIPENRSIDFEEMEITPESLISSIFSIEYPQRVTLFIPLPFYMQFHLEWRRLFDPIDDRFVIGGIPIEVVWSNKYMDFNYLMILERDAVNVSYRTPIENRLEIFYSELNSDELDFTVKSSISYRVVEPSRIKLITPTNLPSQEEGTSS